MGILADISKISGDSTAQATVGGQLSTAQAQVTALQTQFDSFGGTITADDQQLSSDLQALPRPVYVVDPTTNVATFYAFSALPPGFTITPADPAT